MLMGQIIKIQCRQLFVDLMVIEMLDFNMNLGMDFLRRNAVEIDCQYKKVQFNLKSED